MQQFAFAFFLKRPRPLCFLPPHKTFMGAIRFYHKSSFFAVPGVKPLTQHNVGRQIGMASRGYYTCCWRIVISPIIPYDSPPPPPPPPPPSPSLFPLFS